MVSTHQGPLSGLSRKIWFQDYLSHWTPVLDRPLHPDPAAKLGLHSHQPREPYGPYRSRSSTNRPPRHPRSAVLPGSIGKASISLQLLGFSLGYDARQLGPEAVFLSVTGQKWGCLGQELPLPCPGQRAPSSAGRARPSKGLTHRSLIAMAAGRASRGQQPATGSLNWHPLPDSTKWPYMRSGQAWSSSLRSSCPGVGVGIRTESMGPSSAPWPRSWSGPDEGRWQVPGTPFLLQPPGALLAHILFRRVTGGCLCSAMTVPGLGSRYYPCYGN